MYKFLLSCWNYLSLSKQIMVFYRLSLSRTIVENDINEFVQQVIPYVKNCGCVCIKFCQWLTPVFDLLYNEEGNEPHWLKTLETLYENCPNHSLRYTFNQYKEDFDKSLSDTYDIVDIIGSGSIGQVYKIQHKLSNKLFAMKVLHPNVHYDMWFFRYIINLLLRIPYTNQIIYNVLPYDIPKYLDLFEEQLNMIHEANNLCQMYYNYKDNEYINIPTLVSFSSSILLMSYEGGTTLDDIDISEYEKMKLVTILSLFAKHNFEIVNFNHGDVHKGNWKVGSYNDGYRLNIYDFGFCWSAENILISELTSESFSDSNKDDYSKLTRLTAELLNDTSDSMVNYINNYIINNLSDNNVTDPKFTFTSICAIAKQKGLVIDPISIQGILIYIQTYKYWTKYGLNNKNENWETDRNIYRSDYLNSYSLCQTYDIFPEVQLWFKDKLNKKQVTVTELFDMLDDSKNITDEVRSLLEFN